MTDLRETIAKHDATVADLKHMHANRCDGTLVDTDKYPLRICNKCHWKEPLTVEEQNALSIGRNPS